VIFNIALETLLGTAGVVKVLPLTLNWDIAELSRLSRYFLYSWIWTHRNCQDFQGTSIPIELGHISGSVKIGQGTSTAIELGHISGIFKIVKVRLLQLNWDTSAALSRYFYCNWTGTHQRKCQDCQGTSTAIELGHISGIFKIVKVRLLQLNWGTSAALSRYFYCNWTGTHHRHCQGSSIAIELGHIIGIVKVLLLQLNWDTSSALSRYFYCNWIGTHQRKCQDCQGTSTAIELGHISGIVKVLLLQLNWDTSAEMSRLSRYVYCNWTGTHQRHCQGTSIAIELGHIIGIVKVLLLQLNWDTSAEMSRLSRYIYFNWIGTHQQHCQDCQGTSTAIELGHISGIVKVLLLQLNWDTSAFIF